MFGLMGQILVAPEKRDELIAILIEGTAEMPGCLLYLVAKDRNEPDAIWVTEVWENEASHQASFTLPAVQQALAQGKPLMTGVGERFEFLPVGGFGLRKTGS